MGTVDRLHFEKDRKREKKRARSARRRRAAPPQAADSRCAKLNAIFGSAVLREIFSNSQYQYLCLSVLPLRT